MLLFRLFSPSRCAAKAMKKYIAFALFFFALFLAAYIPSTHAENIKIKQPVRSDNLLLLDAAYAGKSIVAVGERGQILISADSGLTWRQAKSPTQATLTALTFVDANNGWAVGHDAVILRTSDGGENWQQIYSAPDQQKPLLDVWFKNTLVGYAVGAYGSYYETRDGGKTWHLRKILKDDMHINAIAGGTDGKLFIVGEAGTLYRSGDDGANWEELPSPYKGSFFGALRLGSDSLLIFGLRGHIYRSENFGQSWSAIASGSQASLMGGNMLDAQSLVLVGYDGTVLSSHDQGKTFIHYKKRDSKALAAVLSKQQGSLLLFGEAGFSRLALKK